MDPEFALTFTEEWQAAWNSHDVDRILTHYADDVVFQSPHVTHRFQEPTGEVHGKEALRAYWASGLAQQPDLRFTVDDVRISGDTLVVNYRYQHGHAVSDVLRFRAGLVCWGCGAYVPGDSLAATRSLDRRLPLQRTPSASYPPGVTCVRGARQGLGAEGSGPEALVKVERLQRSEDERP